MCGINAYWETLPNEVGQELLRQMNARVVHRGPDGEGYWVNNHVGLAHRRLSIIDLQRGAQPMVCCAGRYVITFNGEIYNYRELRALLVKDGYCFQTKSDTEVIPSVIDRFGLEEGLNRLRGMFAFVIYDTCNDELILARDYVGIKPLYIVPTRSHGWLVCSELKSAMGSEMVDNVVHGGSILDFLRTGYIVAPRSAWQGVEEIRPGHWLRISRSGVKRGCFWKWRYSATTMEVQDAMEQAEEVMRSSVEAHLVSDVPVACFLSGGVDSSLITALASQQSRSSIDSFNVAFDEDEYNEAPYARSVASHCQTTHHEIPVKVGQGSPELLETVISQYDQPFGDSSCLPTYLVCQAVSRHCKVVLSGDGGDEMFGGYSRYGRAASLLRISQLPLASSACKISGRFVSTFRPDLGRQLQKMGQLVGKPRREIALSLLTYFNENEIKQLLHPDVWKTWVSDHGFADFSTFFRGTKEPFSAQFIDFEVNSRLHADYLRKIDIASMAHGLEVRTPFLDRRVFSLAESIPVSLNVTEREQKRLLKRLAERFVPRKTIYRQKWGFGIPFDRWADNHKMREFIRDLLVSPNARNRCICRPAAVEALFSAFINRQPSNLSRYQVYQRVFMLLSLELWLRRWNPSLK